MIHEQVLEDLKRINIDGKDLRMIKILYWSQNAAVIVEGELSDWVEIQRGVRQGCVLSHDLFNLYSEGALIEIRDVEGIKNWRG